MCLNIGVIESVTSHDDPPFFKPWSRYGRMNRLIPAPETNRSTDVQD